MDRQPDVSCGLRSEFSDVHGPCVLEARRGSESPEYFFAGRIRAGIDRGGTKRGGTHTVSGDFAAQSEAGGWLDQYWDTGAQVGPRGRGSGRLAKGRGCKSGK